MSFIKRGTVLVVAFAAVCVVQAQPVQTGTIEGRVENAAVGKYLNNARITVVGASREVFTDSTGSYRITNVPEGEAELQVFYTGFSSQSIKVKVAAGATAVQNFSLKAYGEDDVVHLGEFVVASERETNAAAVAINEQRFAANRKDVVSTDAFGEINQGNIGEFVKFLPGVSLDVKDGNTPSGIMVRGFDPNYTNVTMDGGQLASTIIANTQTSSRQFVLESMNINNIARIELVKLPTPDMSANLLGGAVNFISKSAFERSRQELRISTYLSANAKGMDFKKTPGPFDSSTFKILPSVDAQYVNPVNDRFGFVVTAQQSSQFYLQNKSVLGYRFTSAGATLTNPQITSMATSFAPNRSDRTGGAVTLDFKPWDRNVFRLNVQASTQRQQTASRTLTYNVGGTQPISWNEHNTFGAATGGSVGMSTSFQERHALTRGISGSWTFTGNEWTVETAGSFSNSNNRTRDTDKGFFRSLSVNLPNVRTVNIENIETSDAAFGKATVLGASGPIDELKLANWNLTAANNASERLNASDNVKEVRVNITRSFTVMKTPLAIKFGGSINDVERDLEYVPFAFNYLGPDGIASNGDEGLGNYVSATDRGVSPGFGRPAPEWPDPFKIYQDFKAHPNWWTQTAAQQGDIWRNYAIRSPWLHEKITSGYLMADSKLLDSRLRIVGGVRYELTEDEGRGFRQDADAVLVKDANGNVLDTNPTTPGIQTQIRPELGASGSGAYNKVLYTPRGYYNSRDYHYYHPSLHVTYNITENLLFRAEYAKTVGRPNLSDIVPNLFVGENTAFGDPNSSSGTIPGFITGANTGLRPWRAKNYDYTLEYYLPRNGLVMFNAYRKDIRDFFSNQNVIADQALLDQLGISSDALGYQYTKRVNVADARIQGWEARLELPLSNLGMFKPLAGMSDTWAKHYTLMANVTHLDLSGSRITSSDWKRYIPRSRNFGLRFNYPKLSGNFLLNWRGKMLRDTNGSFPGANEYIRARYQFDASIEYQMTKRYSVFFAGRNLLNASSQWEVSGPGVPAWATITNFEDYGAQYSLGLRGTW